MTPQKIDIAAVLSFRHFRLGNRTWQRPGTSMVPGRPYPSARRIGAGGYDWLKKPLSAMRALSCAVTWTLCGLNRNTLAVTRSMRP